MKKVFMIFTFLLLSGCATNIHMLDDTVRPAKDPKHVSVHQMLKPSCQAQEIAIFQNSNGITIEDAKVEGAKIGADFVVMGGMTPLGVFYRANAFVCTDGGKP